MGGVKAVGLADLVKDLRGPLFKDVNRELRSGARLIAADMVPMVAHAVARSPAPQAAAMSKTVRPHSDRVPVVVVGKTNPRFSTKFKGGNTRRRRGALALGVVSGPAGPVNYYAPQRRDPSWGALGDAIAGPILREAEVAYLKLYIGVLKAHGFKART